jgi:hypothetical protein
MCAVWHCHSWIFSVAIEVLIFSLLMACGTLVNGLVCRIWGEVRDDHPPSAAKSRTANELPMSKAA